jgi:uncharacterized membrane protein YgaE (UPF0421/DUF939 family)
VARGEIDGRVIGDWPGLAELSRRSRATLRDRLHRVRVNVWLALQSGLAAGLAWFIAHQVINHPRPFFAPISAVITLAVSVGQRLRRAFELVVGVALGIGIGDTLIWKIGTGPWQIGLVVALAIIVAIFLGSGSALVTQAASSAVLVATLTPPSTGALNYTRFIDALVGGGVGLTVMALLLPLNPLTVVSRAANPLLDALSEGLIETARALAGRDRDRAHAALARLRSAEADLRRFQDALAAGQETATVAPVRWRVRGALAQYVESAEYVARALRNTRVLVRRSVVLLRDGEVVPPALPRAVDTLGDAVSWLRKELGDGVEPEATRGRALRAVGEAAEAYKEGVGFSGSVVVAQVRSTANDLLRASGVRPPDADRLVRRAVGRVGPTVQRAPAEPAEDRPLAGREGGQ